MNDVALLALKDHAVQKWDDLYRILTIRGFDRYDFTAMKFLILLNPSTKTFCNLNCISIKFCSLCLIAYVKSQNESKSIAVESRCRIKSAWLEYRKNLFVDPEAHMAQCLELIR